MTQISHTIEAEGDFATHTVTLLTANGYVTPAYQLLSLGRELGGIGPCAGITRASLNALVRHGLMRIGSKGRYHTNADGFHMMLQVKEALGMECAA